MPKRWCADCGALFDMDSAPGLRCPPCQRVHGQRTERQRAAIRGTTAQRGYDSKHQQLKAELLRQWQPGDPCAHCGQPMTSKTGLDLAHTGDRTGYRGLAHAACNRGNR